MDGAYEAGIQPARVSSPLDPRALPWAGMSDAFGVRTGGDSEQFVAIGPHQSFEGPNQKAPLHRFPSTIKYPERVTHTSPGQRPGFIRPQTPSRLKACLIVPPSS